MSVPRKLEETVKKVLSKNGCSNVTVRDSVFDEVLLEEDVAYIAKYMLEWQTFLAALGLEYQDGKDIIDDINLSSPKQKRVAVLMRFGEIHGVDATYKKLMLAFYSVKRMDLVSKVVESVAKRLKNLPPASRMQPMAPTASRVEPTTATAIRERTFDIRNIMEVLAEGEFSAANSELLGVHLGVKKYILHNIAAHRRGSVDLQLMDILEHWLNVDLEASWAKLADAVEKCNYRILAVAIRGANQVEIPAQDAMASGVLESDDDIASTGAEDAGPRILRDGIEASTGTEDVGPRKRLADVTRPKTESSDGNEDDENHFTRSELVNSVLKPGFDDKKDTQSNRSCLSKPGVRKKLLCGVFVAALVAIVSACWIYKAYSSVELPSKSTVELPSKPILYGNREDLYSALHSIKNWYPVCRSLGVSQDILDFIAIHEQTIDQRRRECLASYLRTGRADWKEVILIIGRPPFYYANLSCDIAKQHLNIGKEECTALLHLS